MTPPGRKRPRSSASLMMKSAARSLTDPPGLRNSALPRIVHPVSSEARRNLIIGVSPTVPIKPSRIFMPLSLPRVPRQDYRRRESRRNTHGLVDLALGSSREIAEKSGWAAIICRARHSWRDQGIDHKPRFFAMMAKPAAPPRDRCSADTYDDARGLVQLRQCKLG